MSEVVLLRPYQINRFYSRRIDEICKFNVPIVIRQKISQLYSLRNFRELGIMLDDCGYGVLKYAVCLAIASSRNFDLAKHFLKYEFKNVPKFEIFKEPIGKKYDIKNTVLDDESDYIQWSKLFTESTMKLEFRHVFLVNYFDLTPKPRQNNFELSQLEFLGIPFQETEDRYKGKIMLKNCIYLTASEMMTEKNVSKNMIIDFKPQKFCIEDLKFQADFIKSFMKLNEDGKNKAKRFILKFREIATDRQNYVLDRLCMKIFGEIVVENKNSQEVF